MKNLKPNKHLQAALQLSQNKTEPLLAQTKKPQIQSMTAEVLSNEETVTPQRIRLGKLSITYI
ncbi:hypothetical protein B1F79_02605 [Coxiella-like endosymbiont of Rhipicephalus sanguineus]|nr:hypothetical protein [Coxiella-like endosymbiont of Rhipicephalus sanguineus]